MKDTGMIEFAHVGVNLLRAFILVQNPAFNTGNLPNKGNLVEAYTVVNLISISFNGRSMHNYKRKERHADRQNNDALVEPAIESLTVYEV